MLMPLDTKHIEWHYSVAITTLYLTLV